MKTGKIYLLSRGNSFWAYVCISMNRRIRISMSKGVKFCQICMSKTRGIVAILAIQILNIVNDHKPLWPRRQQHTRFIFRFSAQINQKHLAINRKLKFNTKKQKNTNIDLLKYEVKRIIFSRIKLMIPNVA